MSELRTHLRSRVRALTNDVRNGMSMRTERAWLDEDEAHQSRVRAWRPEDDEEPDWAVSPRRRFHHGIRVRVQKLRVARRRLETLLALEEKAKAA